MESLLTGSSHKVKPLKAKLLCLAHELGPCFLLVLVSFSHQLDTSLEPPGQRICPQLCRRGIFLIAIW